MSWDIELVGAEVWTPCACAECGHAHQRLSRPVLYSDIFWPEGIAREAWSGINGKTGAEAEPELSMVVADMEARPDHYRRLNPPKGIGSYETHRAMLRDLRDACAAHPTAVLRVS